MISNPSPDRMSWHAGEDAMDKAESSIRARAPVGRSVLVHQRPHCPDQLHR
jgi:hypothetical protein